MKRLFALMLPMLVANIVWGAAISSSPVLVMPSGITLNNFSVLRTASAAVCTPADGGDLDVSVSPAGGLRIAGGMAAIGGSCDFLVGFDFAAPTGIEVIGLTFNGAAAGLVSFAEVTESVFDEHGYLIGQTNVNSAGDLQSGIVLPGLTKGRVLKDILLVAGGTSVQDGRASISFIDQEFELGTTGGGEVPEPGTSLLLGSTGSAILLVRRIKRVA